MKTTPLLALAVLLAGPQSWAQTNAPANAAPPTLEIQADKVKGQVSPLLYGLMTEEINYSYEGGLYAELICNRTFKYDDRFPMYWHLIQSGQGGGSWSIETNHPLN